jgi:hypothetical protein
MACRIRRLPPIIVKGAPHESYYSVTTLVLEVMGLDD